MSSVQLCAYECSRNESLSNTTGYEPQPTEQGIFSDADRAATYVSAHQPGRVKLTNISWYRHFRSAGQGLLPGHMHDIAKDICLNGTSKRRYNVVKVVEVPEHATASWLTGNAEISAMNPLMADFQAMSHTTGQLYAALRRVHFVEAHKIILEGGRHYHNDPDGLRFQLRDDDTEGRLIHEQGVEAIVYTSKLWDDLPAIRAILRVDSNMLCAEMRCDLALLGDGSSPGESEPPQFPFKTFRQNMLDQALAVGDIVMATLLRQKIAAEEQKARGDVTKAITNNWPRPRLEHDRNLRSSAKRARLHDEEQDVVEDPIAEADAKRLLATEKNARDESTQKSMADAT